MNNQVISLAGAALILSAYLAFQRGWLGRSHRLYHAMNLVGSSLLTVVALSDHQAGFIVLEGAWALLSIPGTLRPPPAAAPTTV
jgi:hypothetical protein